MTEDSPRDPRIFTPAIPLPPKIYAGPPAGACIALIWLLAPRRRGKKLENRWAGKVS